MVKPPGCIRVRRTTSIRIKVSCFTKRETISRAREVLHSIPINEHIIQIALWWCHHFVYSDKYVEWVPPCTSVQLSLFTKRETTGYAQLYPMSLVKRRTAGTFLFYKTGNFGTEGGGAFLWAVLWTQRKSG